MHLEGAPEAAPIACRSRRLLQLAGVHLETTIPSLFVAGVVVAGYDANKVFIENGRYHGDKIVARLTGAHAPAEPKLSAELDT